MYVVRTATARARYRTLASRIRDADAATGQRLVAGALPEHLARIAGPDTVEDLRQRVLQTPASGDALLRPRDFLEAVGVFAMVVVATFPVVAPFMLVDDTARAMRWSQATTLVMLFFAGAALARYAGMRRPVVTGVATAMFGVVLITAVVALGG